MKFDLHSFSFFLTQESHINHKEERSRTSEATLHCSKVQAAHYTCALPERKWRDYEKVPLYDEHQGSIVR